MLRLSIALALLVACSHRHDAPAPAPGSAAVTGTAPAVGAHVPSVQLTAMSGERVALDSVLSAHDKTIVVFYRGFYWGACRRWLGELARHAADIASRGGSVIAIACDSVADATKLQSSLPQLTLLEDPDKTAATAWGVLPAGGDEPDAATFVVRRDGTVAFRRLADPSHDWPTYDELSAALQ